MPASSAVRRLSSKRGLSGSSRRSRWRTTIRVAAPPAGTAGRGAPRPAPGAADVRTASARALARTARALFLAAKDNLPNGALAGHRVLLGAQLRERRGRGGQIDEIARDGALERARVVRTASDGVVANHVLACYGGGLLA